MHLMLLVHHVLLVVKLRGHEMLMLLLLHVLMWREVSVGRRCEAGRQHHRMKAGRRLLEHRGRWGQRGWHHLAAHQARRWDGESRRRHDWTSA